MSRCLNCGKPAPGPRNPRYCSDRCRAIAWRGRRASGQADRDARVRMALAKVDEAVQEAREVLAGRE